MNFTVIIPARYDSLRLPGKPLLQISGKTMIQRVYEQASLSDASKVIVATDDGRIEAAVAGFGGEVCLTSSQHQSGTDRLQEVASKLELKDEDIVVNVQGDEPLIPPAVINQVAANLAESKVASAATLCEPIESTEAFLDPNLVKVVCDQDGMALYFSRAPIPWPREAPPKIGAELAEGEYLRHIGVYAYRAGLLNQFVQWPQAPLEELERLEQLRILWKGHRIHVQRAVELVPPGVDTESDLEHIRQLMAQ